MDRLATASAQKNRANRKNAVYVRQQTERSLKTPYLRTRVIHWLTEFPTSFKRKIAMNSYRILVSSILLASSLGVVAAPLVSDPQNCGPMGARGENWEHRAGNIEMHHQKLHAALKLMPDQEGAWKKLMDSEPARAKVAPGKSEDWSKLTTPERADKMLERMKEHQAQQTEHVAALKEFYAVLTPEQKKTFDEFHSTPRAGMRGKQQNRSSSSAIAPTKP